MWKSIDIKTISWWLENLREVVQIHFFFFNVKALFLYTKLPGLWFDFLSVQNKVIANWSKKSAIVQQFAFSWHLPNLDYLAGHLGFLLSDAFVRSQIFSPFQEAQDGHRLLYQTVAAYCSTPVNWRNQGVGHGQKYLCFVPVYIFIHLGVQEDGDGFPKTLAIEIKDIIPILCEIKSKNLSCYNSQFNT